MNHSFVARSLDEIQFWSRIMKEHSLFLSFGFTYEQKQLIDEPRYFISLFERIEEKLSRFSSTQIHSKLKHSIPKYIKLLLLFGLIREKIRFNLMLRNTNKKYAIVS